MFHYLLLVCIPILLNGRSIHRAIDKDIPTIVARWPHSEMRYTLHDWHLEESAFFKTFNKDFFMSHQLPLAEINFRNDPSQVVTGEHLDKLINRFIEEVMIIDRPQNFTDFIIIKDKDFNYKNHSGLIIIAFKNFPFIVKIFIENPQSFVQPFSKGFEPSCFFMMGGGINRYLSGFTRIPNLEIINQQIQKSDYWRDRADVPRKWFWQPKNNKWFEVTGYNFGRHKEPLTIMLPSIYAIVCDKINHKDQLHMHNKEDRTLALALSDFYGSRIDRNISNFVVEVETNKFIVVDCEHFPSMVGLREPLECDTYVAWYTSLIKKCLGDTLFRHKKYRRDIQAGVVKPIMTIS